MMGTLLKSKFPDASQGSTLKAGLPKDNGLTYSVNSFLHKYFKTIILTDTGN